MTFNYDIRAAMDNE